MANSIPVSQRINIQVTLTPQAAQGQSLDTLLLLQNSDLIDPIERYRLFTSVTEVAEQLGAGTDAYNAAVAYFSQVPKPRQMYVGLWARSAKKGGLRGGVLTKAQQNIADWNLITAGGFSIAINGGSAVSVTGMNFATATTMFDVATVVQAALTAATVAVSFTWNEGTQRFECLTTATGAASVVAFLTAPGSGTNISDDLKMRTGDGGYSYFGLDSESATDVVALYDDLIGQRFYALGLGDSSFAVSDSVRLQMGRAVQALSNKHVFVSTTNDTDVLSAVSTTDIAAAMKAEGLSRSYLQYSSTNPQAAISAWGRMLTVDYSAENSAITLMYKQQPTVVAEALTSTQSQVLQDKNCNVFAAYDNDTNILQFGTMADGTYADVVAGTDWLAVTLQTELWNVFYTGATKIPQTNTGVHRLVTKAEGVCAQAVVNGLLAPGRWDSDGFGSLKTGDILRKGFYVYAQPVENQTAADRAARKAPAIQVAAKLAGAVHDVTVGVLVNQ